MKQCSPIYPASIEFNSAKVEATLFRIHRYFLERDSPLFNAMFSLPQKSTHIEGGSASSRDTLKVEGEVDENPVILPEIQARDFERLLSIIYPTDFLNPELTTVDEWISVFDPASRWEISSIRQLALERLNERTGSADKIAIGKRFDVKPWLLTAYTDLVTREKTVDMPEALKTGLEDVVEIGDVRRKVRYAANLNRHPDSVKQLVKSCFIDAP